MRTLFHPFLHEDEKLAAERNHLTARQAGELAKAAGAAKLAPFHFSPRYEGRHEALVEEAAQAFGFQLGRSTSCTAATAGFSTG